MTQDSTDDKWILVQVMAWCRQAASHYPKQCWPNFCCQMAPLGTSTLIEASPIIIKYQRFAHPNTLEQKMCHGCKTLSTCSLHNVPPGALKPYSCQHDFFITWRIHFWRLAIRNHGKDVSWSVQISIHKRNFMGDFDFEFEVATSHHSLLNYEF